MSTELYRLRDLDNRDENGAPFEFSVPTLTEMIPYVDGPLRSDMTSDEGHGRVDQAIDALRRENFPVAEQRLRECGVYINLEVHSDE
ncbi:hypothetical protein [Zhihengliuella flava]|uniref:Uncharacterized protein n=1 Tax=Zhihengliuella flava TaxID=1285193 RepID=A0A931D6C7_9MICC|nr:hypothetical protein [Zhihengliuella flava]MBG6083259.1 hypothetical protein [Zhihengliuella flava]